ncbi:MAG: InlB B-repeat-containing protein [Treponema sp.]|nr:InlB B-repeat-containing protein [Treponema sp.]
MKKILSLVITAFLVFTAMSCDKPIEEDEFKVIYNKNNNDEGSTEAYPDHMMVYKPDTFVPGLPVTEPTRIGYSFKNWNTAPNGSGSVFTALTTVTRSMTVYAQWNQIAHFVYFNKNNNTAGSTEASPRSLPVFPGEEYIKTMPSIPMRSGFVFTEWNTKPDGSGETFTMETPVTTDITVYAQWVQGYTVIFDKNNEDTGSTEASPMIKGVISPKSTVEDLPSPPSRDAFEFSGWNTEPDGKGENFTADTEVTAPVIVYAQWRFTGGIPIIVGATLVHNNPLMERGSGFAGSISQTDGSVSFSDGHFQYKFPTGNDFDISDYSNYIVYYTIIDFVRNSTNPSSGSGARLRQYNSTTTYGDVDNEWPWLIDYKFLEFTMAGAGTSGGFSIQFNGAKPGGRIVIKIDNITFFKVASFDVSFDLNGGDGDPPAIISVPEGRGLGSKMPQKPTKTIEDEEWYFTGWYNEANQLVTAGTPILRNTTLKAMWDTALNTIIETAAENSTLFNAVGDWVDSNAKKQTFEYDGKFWWVLGDSRGSVWNNPDAEFGDLTAIKEHHAGGYSRLAYSFPDGYDEFNLITITYDMVHVCGTCQIEIRRDAAAGGGSSIHSSYIQHADLTAGTNQTLTRSIAAFNEEGLVSGTATGSMSLVKAGSSGSGVMLVRITKIEFHY